MTKPSRSVADDLGTPQEIATYLHTSIARLAQMRYQGTGPRFVKVGRRVLYRWVDVRGWLDENTHQSTPKADTPTHRA